MRNLKYICRGEESTEQKAVGNRESGKKEIVSCEGIKKGRLM
jgi:hypothetical protein